MNFELEAALLGLRRGPKPPIVWICTALIDDKAYLFDARLGLEIPGPDGTGVATLEQALADPAILERMNLPGLSPYGTSRASLLGSRTKIGILIDSSTGYFSPKMRLLQGELAGKDRTILYRDPAEQRDHFAQVLGDRSGGVSLWALPLEVETRLFSDQQFVAVDPVRRCSCSGPSSPWFMRGSSSFVVSCSMKRSRTTSSSGSPRMRRWVTNKKRPIPQDVQDGLDVYATYYLHWPTWSGTTWTRPS